MASPQSREFILELAADLCFQAAVDEYFRNVLEKYYGDSGLASAMQLVVSEAFTNVARHAYPDDTAGPLRIELRVTARVLEFRIIDSGAPFDPDGVPAPNVEGLQVGGYGLHIIRNMVDVFEYASDNGRNTLRLEKHL